MTTQELKQYIDRVLGNSIRCLLPSYWWKRLFSLTLEKVDEKLDATNIKTINGESIVGEGNLKVGVTTVGSIDELNALEASVGDIATVGEESMLVSVGDLQQVDDPSEILEKWDSLTRIVKVEFGEPVTGNGYRATVYLNEKNLFTRDTILITSSEGGFLCGYGVVGEMREITIEEVNERLKKHDYRFIIGVNVDAIDSTFKLHTYSISANAYIKGDSWERIAKESDLEGIEGGNSIIVLDNGTTQKNADAFKKILHAYENDLGVLVLYKEDAVGAFVKQFYTTRRISYANDKIYLNLTKDNDSSDKIYQYTLSADGKLSYNSSWNETTIDEVLSETSTNAIQNKAVYAALQNFVNDFQFSIDNLSESDRQISQEVNNKVDKTYVDNAIANAITTTLNTAV